MSLGRITRQVLGALAVAAATAASAAHAGTLRICTDPDNLPFSKADGPEKGLYVELADLVSRQIGETPEYVWWLSYNQRKALRNTILQDSCDAYFALPADADYKLRGLQRTRAFLDLSYALVAPPALKVGGLADLRGKRIGVLHGSPPHILLASREGYTSTSFRDTGEAMQALAQGQVDAAILWGPSAGYENSRHFSSRFAVTPVTGDGLAGSVAVAVRRGHDELAQRIDRALVELQPQIRTLAEKYGFPQARPLPLSANQAVRDPRAGRLAGQRVVQAGVVAAAWQPAGVLVAQAASTADAGPGRTRFNDTCSHCHGANGASPVSERDLRKLRSRYKDDWRNVALKTIREGRPDLGMPTWKSTFNEQQIEELLAFLATIQR